MPATRASLAVIPLESRLTPSNSTLVAVGADVGAAPRVQVYRLAGEGPGFGALHNARAELVADFYAFDRSFTGGVRVACGDVDGDRVADLTVAAGPGGGPHVKVFRGFLGADVGDDAAGFDLENPYANFFAYAPEFRGGVNVAVAQASFVVAASVGAPQPLRGYVVTAPGEGGGPHVKVFEGTFRGLSDRPTIEFMAYDEGFRGGASVAAIGNSMPPIPRLRQFGDERDPLPSQLRLVTGAGPGGGPHVRAFDIDLLRGRLTPESEFFAYESGFRGGVTVGLRASVTGNDSGPNSTWVNAVDVVTTAGPGGPGSPRAFSTDGVFLKDLVIVPAGTPKARTTVVNVPVRNTLPADGIYLQALTNLSPYQAVGFGGEQPQLQLSQTELRGELGQLPYDEFSTLPDSRLIIDLPDEFVGGVHVG